MANSIYSTMHATLNSWFYCERIEKKKAKECRIDRVSTKMCFQQMVGKKQFQILLLYLENIIQSI